MEIAAIYNVFDGLELLEGSIECIRDQVKHVIVVAQDVSNFGESDDFVYPYCEYLKDKGLVDHIIKYTPYAGSGLQNETRKRQVGIDFAKKLKASHFLSVDCDEYYITEEFQKICFHGCEGGFCLRLKTYYKSPHFILENPENYYVPFIHTLRNHTTTGLHNPYPFHVDPTRRINEKNVKLIDGVFMHHFSYIRLDIRKKIENSTARNNLLKKSWIYQEFDEAKAGDFIQLFEQKIIETPDKFNINGKIQNFQQYKASYYETVS